MTTPKRTDPLTEGEVAKAAELFFPLFDIVKGYLPEGSTTEDAIKLSETVFHFAQTLRAIDRKEDATAPFGFNKKENV